MELQSKLTKVGQLLQCMGVVVAKISTKILAHFWYIIVLLEVEGPNDRSQGLVNLMNELCLQRCIVNILRITGVPQYSTFHCHNP